MTEPALVARFYLDYGAFRLDVDLRLPGSGVSVLFGDSGSGKTTLLRCIAGLERAPAGYLAVNGEVWQDSERGVFLPAHRRPLGYVFQEANLFPHLSARANLLYGLKRVAKAMRPANIEQIVDLLAIGPLLERMPARLSGGERQRVAIARALAVNPQLLLMDEPLSALDDKRKQEILPYLTRLHRELQIPIIYVTHSRQEVAQLADFLVLLAQGKIQAAGALAATLTSLDAAPAYDKQAASVWQACVRSHEPQYQLTNAEFSGGMLSLPLLDLAPGSHFRIQIHARDVSIALQPPTASSILNVLPARISGIANGTDGQTVVKLAVGEETLLAHITLKSAQLLQLETGMPVYAQIKGTSILN